MELQSLWPRVCECVCVCMGVCIVSLSIITWIQVRGVPGLCVAFVCVPFLWVQFSHNCKHSTPAPLMRAAVPPQWSSQSWSLLRIRRHTTDNWLSCNLCVCASEQAEWVKMKGFYRDTSPSDVSRGNLCRFWKRSCEPCRAPHVAAIKEEIQVHVKWSLRYGKSQSTRSGFSF